MDRFPSQSRCGVLSGSALLSIRQVLNGNLRELCVEVRFVNICAIRLGPQRGVRTGNLPPATAYAINRINLSPVEPDSAPLIGLAQSVHLEHGVHQPPYVM